MAMINREVRLLRVGDIVSLRSGGPEMTVLAVQDDNRYQLVEVGWFAKAKRFVTDELPPESLILVRPVDDGASSRR